MSVYKVHFSIENGLVRADKLHPGDYALHNGDIICRIGDDVAITAHLIPFMTISGEFRGFHLWVMPDELLEPVDMQDEEMSIERNR